MVANILAREKVPGCKALEVDQVVMLLLMKDMIRHNEDWNVMMLQVVNAVTKPINLLPLKSRKQPKVSPLKEIEGWVLRMSAKF